MAGSVVSASELSGPIAATEEEARAHAVVPERSSREGDQALPWKGGESVFAAIRSMLDSRESIGIRRYGRSLETFNGRDAHRDEIEEFLDGFVYRQQMRLERAALDARLARIWELIPEDVRGHARDAEHAVELLATSETAASQAAFQCCARSAWGDGEHDQGCPKAALEAELVQLRSDLDLARADLASHVEALDRRCARLREERDTANEVVARVTRALNGREEELAAARANAAKAMAERDAALLQLGEAGKFTPQHQEG